VNCNVLLASVDEAFEIIYTNKTFVIYFIAIGVGLLEHQVATEQSNKILKVTRAQGALQKAKL